MSLCPGFPRTHALNSKDRELIKFCRAVFVSFGGLLLYLEGPYKKLAPLRIDHVYLLLKK